MEITSYILLSKLHEATNEELAYLIPITKWINSQRNSLGGFYSTQDTVVALEALSKFASATYAKNMNLRITYNFNTYKNLVYVNDVNRLLVQKTKLDRFNELEQNNFKFGVEGFGTVLVQLIFKYNLIEEKNQKALKNNFEFSIFSNQHPDKQKGCSSSLLNINAK